eukprot:5996196-Prymnesium_polylepis.1
MGSSRRGQGCQGRCRGRNRLHSLLNRHSLYSHIGSVIRNPPAAAAHAGARARPCCAFRLPFTDLHGVKGTDLLWCETLGIPPDA